MTDPVIKIAFDLPPIGQLAARLQVMAASGSVVSLQCPADYARAVAGRLNRADALQGQIDGLRAQFAIAVDGQIALQNRCVTLILCNLIFAAVAVGAIAWAVTG